MQKLFFVTAFIFSAFIIRAQSFTGAGGAIPGTSLSQTFFPVTVSGVGTINATYGLAQVCINITHPQTDEIEILLQAPDGTIVPLSIQNGGSGNNYTGTCFTAVAGTSVKFGGAPFSGSYLPEGHLGAVNNGQNANGIWNLVVQDRRNGSNAGAVNNFTLSFTNVPAPQPPAFPACSGIINSGIDCASATLICDFNGQCGNTAGSTVLDWPGSGLDGPCFQLQNNTFVKFVAAASTASFSVWVPTHTNGGPYTQGGVQMLFFEGTCGSGAVIPHGCYPHILPYSSAANPLISVVSASGLTIGNTYYLMIDGFSGDNTTFRIAANTGVNILDVSPQDSTVCVGQSVSLTASGGNGVFNWSPSAGLNTTSGATVIATVTDTTTYTVTTTTAAGCPNSKTVTINTNPLPIITTEPSATVQNVCQNKAVTTLSVTATAGSGSITGYQWYITTMPSNTGGAAFPGATSSTYTPSSANVGTLYFYCKVTNSNGCSTNSAVSGALIVSATVATPAATAILQPTCLVPTGTLVVTAPSGANIQYSIGGAYQVSGTFSSLTAGPYNITAKNIVTGCVSNIKLVTLNNLPAGPATPVASVTVQPTCLTPTGTIDISSPLGATIEYSIGGAYQAATSFTGLTNGTTYSITAKDIVTGCISSPFLLAINTIPGAPVAPTGSVSTQPDCNTPAGTITITGPSGANIEYSIGGAYQASGVFTGLTPGTTYTVTAKDISSGCVSPPSTLIVNTITPAAPPTVTSPVTYCENAMATALTATGSNLLWYTVVSGGVGSGTAPIPSTVSVSTNNYYVSQTIGSCESPRAVITVTVSPTPAAPTVASPVIYCQNTATVSLTATGTSVSWYTTASGGIGSTTAPTPSSSTAGNTTYYVSQANGSCESPRAAIIVTVTPTPVAPTITSPVTYCQNTTATSLTATGSNLLWYAVATGGISSATAPTPVTTAPGNTIYYVSQTITGCEGPRAAITVTVNPNPAAPTVTSPVIYCQNATAIPLTATGSNLLWYTVASGGIGSATAPVPLTTATGNTIYYVSQTVTGCESPRATITVTVNPNPVAPNAASPVTYCQNIVSAPLTATGTNLLWYTAATGGTGLSVAPVPSTATPGNTFFYVSQTVNGCESPRRGITVTINAASTAVSNFKYNPDTVCINAINSPGPAYALGFTNGGTFTATPAGLSINPNNGNIILTSSIIGTYNVTYTYNTTGCVTGSSYSSPIIILPGVPTVTIFSYSSPVCKNAPNVTPATKTGFTTGGNFSSSQGLAINSGTGVIDISNSLPGTYQVTYNLRAAGCRLATSNFSFITIVDTTSPVTGFSYSPDNICISGNNPTMVRATGFTTGGIFSATPAGLSINSSTGNISIGLSVPGVYIITYNVPSFLCRLADSSSTTFTIKAYASPITDFSYFSPVCKGDGTATPVPAADFSTGGIFSSTTGLLIDQATGIIDLTQSIAGNYVIKYDVAQGVCNPAGSDTASINILSQPASPTVTAASICGAGTINLTASALGTISWYTEPALVNLVNVGNSFNTFLNASTAFYLTNTVGTCASGAAILNAVVNPKPNPPFLGNDTAICSGDKLILNAYGADYNNYLWQDGSIQPTITVSNSGNYKVTVSTGTNCGASSSININVLDNCDDISFPTAFSPNGDSRNDKFGPLGNLFIVKNYSLKVFNRYGEIVFSSSNPYEKWDGTYRGKQSGVNNYVWVASYLYRSRVAKIQKGNLTLVK